MLSFKSYLKEATEVIKLISASDIKKLEKALAPYTYTVKGSSSSTTTIVIRTPNGDRAATKIKIEKQLSSAKIPFNPDSKSGSIGATDIMFGKHIVKVIYKPTSGGMSETTLNSTITELAPSLAFMAGKKKFANPKAFHEFLSKTKGNQYGVYVKKEDEDAGANFIAVMVNSSKFVDKMNNAQAILDYLWSEHDKSPISQVYWGYRAKPENIPNNHKGDIFIKFKNKKMLGVSLKAGGDKTAEPQLNTYVNKMFEDFGNRAAKESLIDIVHKKVHSTIGLPKDWADRSKKSNSIKIINSFKETDPSKYEGLYNKMLEIVRQAIIDNVNANMKNTIKYIKTIVLNKSDDNSVPLVVVKATGSAYKFVTDEDAIETFLPKVKSIKAYAESSKQAWAIDLISSSKTLTLNMTVRSNKSPPDNKIAQGFNLAIKFNGTKEK